MKREIPPPEFIVEELSGTVYLLPDGATLAIGDLTLIDESTHAPLIPTLRGTIHLRYGIAQAQPETSAIIPGMFVSERGAILVGAEMWEFMQNNFQIYPRADVVGLHGVTGKDTTVFLRELDFGVPVRIFAYAASSDTIPTAEITTVLTDDPNRELPPYLARYRPERHQA